MFENIFFFLLKYISHLPPSSSLALISHYYFYPNGYLSFLTCPLVANPLSIYPAFSSHDNPHLVLNAPTTLVPGIPLPALLKSCQRQMPHRYITVVLRIDRSVMTQLELRGPSPPQDFRAVLESESCPVRWRQAHPHPVTR